MQDSKQGLIIALVAFVVLSIVLGLTTYFGYSGQTAANAARDKADKDLAAMKTSRDWEHFQNLTLKSYLGADLKDGQTELATLRGNASLGTQEPGYADFQALVQKMNEQVKWDDAKKQPRDTYFARLEKVESENRKLQDGLAKASETIVKTNDERDAAVKAAQNAQEELNKKLEVSKKETADTIKTQNSQVQDNLKKFEGWEDEIDKLRKTNEVTKDADRKAAEKQARTIKDLQVRNQRLQDRQAPPNAEGWDRPKGRIVNIAPHSTSAYIDLGSADNVKPGLTFSVFGVGPDGKAERERKGAVTVVRVLQPHMSEARLAEDADAGRNPVVRGDMLFNPAWNSNQHEHVAIAGIIDLTGDGRDETQEFIRSLERQGIIVDAYLDLKDMTEKGKGMSLETSYLILGDQADIDPSLALREGQSGLTRRVELGQKMQKMRDDAASKGVQLVSLRHFLTAIGYPVPKVIPGSNSTLPGAPKAIFKGEKENEEGEAPAKSKDKAADKDKDTEAPKEK